MKKIFILVLLAISFLSACGKAAKPVPYEGSAYPHTYPYENNN